MRLKNAAVNIRDLTPQMMHALYQAERIYDQLRTSIVAARWPREMVITSGRDGVHGEKSKHPRGDAADIRTRFIDSPASRQLFRDRLATNLGADYDVVLEKTHLHVEFDPKAP